MNPNVLRASHHVLPKKMITIGALACCCFSLLSFNTGHRSSPVATRHTKLLCVLYDAGETGGLLPVLEKLEAKNKDFLVLVMGTAEKIVRPEMFPDRRITLKDLDIDTVIDTTTARTAALSAEMLEKFQQIKPTVVLVGTVSRIQQQVLEQFSSTSVTVAFVDNMCYDKHQESYQTVEKVQRVAKHVLCPAATTVSIFKDECENNQPIYHVVGKPSLEAWEEEIASVNPEEILKKLNFTADKPIVTFIGGYGPGYEVIDPLFKECAEKLSKHGIQVIVQQHPKIGPSKVKTTEALRVSRVVGYNSSVILDAAILGIPSLFFIPNDPRTMFRHQAIDQGLIPKVSTCEELLASIQEEKCPQNIRKAMGIPKNSTAIITNLLARWMESKEDSKCI